MTFKEILLSFRVTETSVLGDQKKGSSCLSGRSGTSDSQRQLMQSMVSMGGIHSEIDDELNMQGKLILCSYC